MKLAALFSFLFAFAAFSAQAEDIIIFTEENPPFNFRNENGLVDGISTRLVKKLMDETGLSYEIRLVSWVRAMRNAQLLDNALIYSLVYTEERASQFEWLVPLTVTQFFLYGRKDIPHTVTIEDLRAGKYSAVCPLKSYPCTLLDQIGFPKNNVYSISFMDIVEQYKMVASGRVDFFVNEPLTHAHYFKYGNPPFHKDSFRRVLSVGSELQAFLAAGKQVKPETKQKIWQTFERLVAEKRFTPIIPKTTEQAVQDLLK